MKANVTVAVNTTSEIIACRSLEFWHAFMCCYIEADDKYIFLATP